MNASHWRHESISKAPPLQMKSSCQFMSELVTSFSIFDEFQWNPVEGIESLWIGVSKHKKILCNTWPVREKTPKQLSGLLILHWEDYYSQKSLKSQTSYCATFGELLKDLKYAGPERLFLRPWMQVWQSKSLLHRILQSFWFCNICKTLQN